MHVFIRLCAGVYVKNSINFEKREINRSGRLDSQIQMLHKGKKAHTLLTYATSETQITRTNTLV